jgi:hypothetical protein
MDLDLCFFYVFFASDSLAKILSSKVVTLRKSGKGFAGRTEYCLPFADCIVAHSPKSLPGKSSPDEKRSQSE